MPKHVKRTPFFRDILLILICFIATVIGYRHFHKFDAKTFLENSVLKEKSFNTEVIEITSEKGLRSYLLTDTTNPVISVHFIFKNAGTSSEADSDQGLTTILSSILLDGAGRYSSQSFKELLEENAITISYKTTIDDFYGELTYIKDKQNLAIDLLRESLLVPHLKLSDLNRIKEEMNIAQKSQLENPSRFLSLEFNKEVYGVHPYANNPLGNQNTVKNITKQKLKNYLKNNFIQDNLIIGIAGDITKEDAKTLIDNIFSYLPASSSSLREETTKAPISFDTHQKLIDRNIPQNITNFTSPGVCRNDPDFYPLYIANHILGGGQMQTRLFQLTRENEGLTYGAYSYLSIQDQSCTIKGGFATSSANMPKMINIIQTEWQKMGEYGVTQEELNQAKNYLISSFNLRFTSISEIAQQLALMQKQNLGTNFLKERNQLVQNVQLQDVNNAAKVYFNNHNLIFVSIGK